MPDSMVVAGPWTLTLDALGDLEAAAMAGDARVPVGLGRPGERERILVAGQPDGLVGRSLPATIPGCVHVDLVAAGAISDPMLGTHETEQHWVGWASWTYAADVVVPRAARDAPRQELLLPSVSTVAEVWLDGQHLGGVRSQHRTHRFDVSGRLRPGGSRLELRFPGQAAWAEARREQLGALPSPYSDPINSIRSMACQFGWDWGPTLVTAGIWGPVRLEWWSGARLRDVRWSATAPGGRARLRVEASMELEGAASADGPLSVDLEVAGARVSALLDPVAGESAARTVSLTLDVPDAALWWPRSHGEPVTHGAQLTLRGGDSRVLDRAQRRVGFRDVAIRQEADAAGESFAIVINGRRVWVRGVNWIPDDPYPSRVTPERVEARLHDAVDAGVDLVRVWGGGTYESDAFYDACDRLGLLVWQDAPFACAAYPEDPETLAEVEAEFRQAVARLGSHPSLVVWCGGNETTWGWFDWGWPDLIGDRPWGLGHWLELLPRLAAELDADRPYWPNSPWSGSMDRHPNDDGFGTSHLWEVWNSLDASHYRDRRPRFAAEYGYQAPAAWRTLLDSLGPDGLAEDAPAMLAHQKAADGRAKLRRAIDRRFPGVTAFDDWLFFTQLEQARALRTGIGHLRALGEHCTGSVIWQLNDLWPAISWSLVDAAGRRKPAWYAVRDGYADRILTIEPGAGAAGLELVLVNETDHVWQVAPDLGINGTDGSSPTYAIVSVAVPARSSLRVHVPDHLAPTHPSGQLLVADAPGTPRATWWFVEDPAVEGPPAIWSASAEHVEGGAIVRVTAHTIVRELCLFPDRLAPDATVDRMLFMLLPDETVELRVSSRAPLDLDALCRPPVLRAANDGVRAGGSSRR